MIIKSMSRKTSSFSQLIDYCDKGRTPEDKQYDHFHNVYPGQKEEIIRDFEANAEHLPHRKNGVFMYHEVLSFTRSQSLPNERQKEILLETIAEYLSTRAPDCMAYSVIHDDHKDHLHAHIIISSNVVDSPKRHWMEKRAFSKLKKDTEKRVLEQYPEMEQAISIDKKPNRNKTSNKEAELNRRGGRTTQKDRLHADLQVIFASVKTEAELDRALELKGLGKSYRKGNKESEPRFGKADSEKHFRLKTLGLDTIYSQLVSSFEPITDSKATKNEKRADSSKKPTHEKPQGKRSKVDQYPWEANARVRETKAKEPSIADKVRATIKEGSEEWIHGDFTARDTKTRNDRFKAQKEADKNVKSRKEQKLHENIAETAREWIGGDFEARDARARKSGFDKKVDESKTVKEPEDQKLHEKAKEKFDEYVKGDFTARDARSFRAKGEEKKAETAETRNTAHEEAKQAWFEDEKNDEFVEDKVQDWRSAEIARRTERVRKSQGFGKESPSRNKDDKDSPDMG